MKTVQLHLNSCKAGRTCPQTHCASSRQILIHWKYCVKAECPVCVSLRKVVPTSLLQIFPNPLCRAEIMQRIARQQQNASHSEEDDAVPELMESEEWSSHQNSFFLSQTFVTTSLKSFLIKSALKLTCPSNKFDILHSIVDKICEY